MSVFNDPRMRNALAYFQQLQSGVSNPTNATRDLAMQMANMLKSTDREYDDSWLRQYLGYGAPNPTLNTLQQQLSYAGQRAAHTGELDPSWMPAAPSAGEGVPTMSRRQYALDWARTMGKELPVNEAQIQQFLGGNTAAARNLDKQYVLDYYTRNYEWLPTTQPERFGNLNYQDTTMLAPYLSNLDWEMRKQSLAGKVYDPATGQLVDDVGVLGALLQDIAPGLVEQFGPAGFLDIARKAADNILAEAANPNARFGGEYAAAAQTAAAQDTLTPQEQGLVESLKQTGAAMNYNEFLKYLENARSQYGDKVVSAAKNWALENRYNWHNLAKQMQ